MLTPGLHLATLAAQELRKAELNEQWGYMEALLHMIQEMGGRVLRVPDPRFKWRSDYLIQFRGEDALPGTLR